MKKLAAIFFASLYTLTLLSAGIMGGIAGNVPMDTEAASTAQHAVTFVKDAAEPSPVAVHHWQSTGIAHPHLAYRPMHALHLPAVTTGYNTLLPYSTVISPLRPSDINYQGVPVYKLHCVYRI